MNRLEQDAADTLQAYEERQARHKQGYAPRPAQEPACVWLLTLSEQEKRSQDEYIRIHQCPF